MRGVANVQYDCGLDEHIANNHIKAAPRTLSLGQSGGECDPQKRYGPHKWRQSSSTSVWRNALELEAAGWMCNCRSHDERVACASAV